MNLLALGINHKTAPLMVREQVVFTPETTPIALRNLLQQPAVNEAVIFSTCNRTELYTNTVDHQLLKEWLSKQQCLQLDTLESYFYCHTGQEAVKHLFRVASGLDSMVLGEQQVMGQLKQAVALAEQAGAVGNRLSRLFHNVFAVSKQIRNQTQLGFGSISLAYIAVNLAKHIFADLNACTALLIGAGEYIELVATHLLGQSIKHIIVANRSLEKAHQLASRCQAHAIGLADLPAYLKEADIIISATASPLPILGKGAIESALKQRKHRPMFMIDLAVPRDIEPEVAELADAYLYNLDDIQAIIAQNQDLRKNAVAEAEELIEYQAARFSQEMLALNSTTTISNFRQALETFRDQEIQAALQQLQNGRSAQQVISRMGHRLVNKITHTPSVRVREATAQGELEGIQWLQRLFDLK